MRSPIKVLCVSRLLRKNVRLDIVVVIIIFKIRFFDIPFGGRKFLFVNPFQERIGIRLGLGIVDIFFDPAPFGHENTETRSNSLVRACILASRCFIDVMHIGIKMMRVSNILVNDRICNSIASRRRPHRCPYNN